VTQPYWLYLLIKKSTGEYIYLDSSGNIAYTTTPTAFFYTPDGWQRKNIAFARDIRKWGLFRSFSISPAFVDSGATMLRKIALEQTFDAEIELLIQQLTFSRPTPTTHLLDYVDFYRGEVDITKLESDEIFVTVPLIEGGVEKLLNANWDTVFEIDMNPYKSVIMDGIFLTFTKTFTAFNNTFFALSQTPNNNETRNFVIGIGQTAEEGTSFNIAGADVFSVPIPDAYNLSTMNEWFLYATDTVQVSAHLKFLFRIKKTPTGTGGHAKFRLIKSDGTVLFTFADVSFSGSGFNQDYNIDTTVAFTLNPGDKVFLIVELKSTTSVLHIGEPVIVTFTITESASVYSYKSRYKATSVKAITALLLFQKLVEKITGSALNCTSILLEGLQNILVTCGDAMRGIQNAKMKTSLSQFFDFIKAQGVAGIGVEGGKIVIEELTHFFSVATPVNLGQSRNFKWSFAEDLLFNVFRVGYETKETDDVNGKYSFNNSATWQMPNKNGAGKFEAICPYPSDPFFIELYRIKNDGKTTTDDRDDNEIMLLNTSSVAPKSYSADFTTFLSGNIVALANGFPDINLFKSGSQFTVAGSASNNRTFTVLDSALWNTNDLLIFVQEAIVVETVTVTVSFGTTILKRVTYINSDTGVPDVASLFNIEYFSMRRMALRWIKYLNSIAWQFAGQNATFLSTEKNREFKTDNGTLVMDEDADITLGTDRYFKGLYGKFETEVGEAVPVSIAANPNSGFTTLIGEDEFTGILIKGSAAPNTLEPQAFQLLAGPNQDESILK
jgi:hypothetical protein